MLHDAVTQYKDIDTNLTNFKMQVTNELTSNLDSQNQILKEKSHEITQCTFKMLQIEPKVIFS